MNKIKLLKYILALEKEKRESERLIAVQNATIEAARKSITALEVELKHQKINVERGDRVIDQTQKTLDIARDDLAKALNDIEDMQKELLSYVECVQNHRTIMGAMGDTIKQLNEELDKKSAEIEKLEKSFGALTEPCEVSKVARDKLQLFLCGQIPAQDFVQAFNDLAQAFDVATNRKPEEKGEENEG